MDYFNNIIPSSYVQSKNKPLVVYFALHELYSPTFNDKIISGIHMGHIYTVIIKVRYDGNNFFMAGNQFGFNYESLNNIDDLLTIINNKLDDYFSDYNLSDDSVLYVEVTFRQLDNKLLSEFSLKTPGYVEGFENKALVTTRDLNIPVSVNKDSLGNPLLTESHNGYIVNISVKINNKIVNFLDIIKDKSKFLRKNHKDNITLFHESLNFYLLKDHRNNSYILAVKRVKDNSIEKIRYSLDGVVLNHLIDTINNDSVIRKIGEKEIILKDNNPISSKLNLKLKAISKPNSEKSFMENKNIGVIDTETYIGKDSRCLIYALGFKTNLDDNINTYYVNKDTLDSNKIVLEMIDELLRPKYSNLTFYCHNLGGYDVVFLISVLEQYNDNVTNEDVYVEGGSDSGSDSLPAVKNMKYKFEYIFRDSKIIKLKIKKGNRKVTILDSYAMLTKNLFTLGEDFEVTCLKSKFPYSFMTEDTLFYKGNTPDISYYEDIKIADYNLLNNSHWSSYDETIKYLKNDLCSLYEIITKANKQFFRDYDVDMTKYTTISSLAVAIFLKHFYKDNIPNINKSNIYKDIKQAYYGGITEVYRPYGENLFYYDVNSLYPYVGLQDMPGLECSKILYYKESEKLDNLFGFYYCNIEAPQNSYLGLLPVRDKSGISFPVGKWEGWYFSEELKFAKENGYLIKVIKGYHFEKQLNVFDKYVKHFYDIKAKTSNSVEKAVAKSLLNNLLGRFGLNIYKPITELINHDKYNELLQTKAIDGAIEIGNNYLVTYKNKVDKEICDSLNVDYKQTVLNNLINNQESDVSNKDISIVIASAVTSYARIFMSKVKLDILEKGNLIYYTDTDSIVTNKPLDPSLVGIELGKFKLEHNVQRGYFISSKTYLLVSEKGKGIVIKAKGVNDKSLNENSFIRLLKGKDVLSNRQETIRSYSEGFVNLFVEVNYERYGL